MSFLKSIYTIFFPPFRTEVSLRKLLSVEAFSTLLVIVFSWKVLASEIEDIEYEIDLTIAFSIVILVCFISLIGIKETLVIIFKEMRKGKFDKLEGKTINKLDANST